jgi:hypothetical protein
MIYDAKKNEIVIYRRTKGGGKVPTAGLVLSDAAEGQDVVLKTPEGRTIRVPMQYLSKNRMYFSEPEIMADIAMLRAGPFPTPQPICITITDGEHCTVHWTDGHIDEHRADALSLYGCPYPFSQYTKKI